MAEQSDSEGEQNEIKRVGVIGAGQMGNGIAHVFALGGYDVRLSDLTDERLEEARAAISANLDRQVGHQKISDADKAAAMGRISMATDLDIFKDCDLVI